MLTLPKPRPLSTGNLIFYFQRSTFDQLDPMNQLMQSDRKQVGVTRRTVLTRLSEECGRGGMVNCEHHRY